ncbi:MAG: DUF790 family protein [Magnetococcales bacterium]|nr:DUF790 family protein [Magnetococcales bacterium]
MLNRELLRFDRRAGKLHPRFVDTENGHLLDFARDLALVYVAGEGQSREELAETVLPRINGFRAPLVAKGLNKLLLDRCTFRESLEGLEARRMAIFSAAARHLRGEAHNDLEAFRQAVAGELDSDDPDRLALDLHADLPDRQPLIAFDPIEPEALLQRYNMALAQGPLLWSDRLTVQIREADPGRQRRFFQLLKWFQLLATVTRVSGGGAGGFTLELDGPLSLFDVQRKYGIKLASFLPAICGLSHWKLTAVTRLDGQVATLELDETMGLKSHFSRTAHYVPDEFTTFAAQFRKEVADWVILPHPTLLELGGQELAMPDFTFQHAAGGVVHLELFHRWHAGQLPRRLKRLDASSNPPPLVVGVERGLSRQGELVPLLEQSAWFQAHGLLFNQFPPVKRVVGRLEGLQHPAPPG